HLGQPTENLDTMVRVAKPQPLQILGAEGLFLDWRRGVEAYVDPLVEQREGRLTDDEMFAGADIEPTTIVSGDKDGIAGRGKPADFKPAGFPTKFRMLPRDLIVPRHRPCPRATPKQN